MPTFASVDEQLDLITKGAAEIIPLEALRVGADAFASDLNPVAVLLNKVVLEYIPRYGQRLADEVRTWGQWVKAQAEQELAAFYPKDPRRRDADRLPLGAHRHL